MSLHLSQLAANSKWKIKYKKKNLSTNKILWGFFLAGGLFCFLTLYSRIFKKKKVSMSLKPEIMEEIAERISPNRNEKFVFEKTPLKKPTS